MTDDEINGKFERAKLHFDRQLAYGTFSRKDYESNMRDLNIWAANKRGEFKIPALPEPGQFEVGAALRDRREGKS